MMASTRRLEVVDNSLPDGTPLVYEIVGGNLHRTLRGIVLIGTPAEYDVDPGVYEVRLVHPKLGRLTKVLDLTDEPETVLFRDMAPPLELRGRPRAQRTETPAQHPREWPISWWHPSSGRISGGTPSLPSDEGSWDVVSPLPNWLSGIALINMAEAGAIAVCWPPGASKLEIQRSRAGGVVLRPRTGNLHAESMLDYAMGGYSAHASMIRGNAQAYQLIDREHQSPAGALIGAYYLLKTGEARECAALLGELYRNFPELSDAAVAFGSALQQANGDPGTIRDAFLHAFRTGIPVYREGLRRLRAGLDYLFALSEGRDLEVVDAIEAIRPLQTALRYDNAVTSWACERDSPIPVVRERQRISFSLGAAAESNGDPDKEVEAAG